jgi:hypothetical protein
MAQAALQRRDDRTQTLVEVISELTSMEEPRRHISALMTGLDIHYELGDGHPLLGRRMPDLELTSADGARRVYELLHDARPLLLNLNPPGSVDIAGWADRVRVARASHPGEWELPVIGVVSAPSAVLVRPDGDVAWVGLDSQQGLAEALTTWFGPPIAT